jgi:hypothetical protein
MWYTKIFCSHVPDLFCILINGHPSDVMHWCILGQVLIHLLLLLNAWLEVISVVVILSLICYLWTLYLKIWIGCFVGGGKYIVSIEIIDI